MVVVVVVVVVVCEQVPEHGADFTRAGVESRDWEDSMKHDLLQKIERRRQISLSVFAAGLVSLLLLHYYTGRAGGLDWTVLFGLWMVEW